MNEIDKVISKYIILAQVASDGGKGINTLNNLFPTSRLVSYKGYDVKNVYIKKAIHMIQKSKDSIFRFYVKEDWKIANYIVYFNFKLDGKRFQVSFHSFKDWSRYKRKDYQTRWNKRDSREACLRLYEEIKKEGFII